MKYTKTLTLIMVVFSFSTHAEELKVVEKESFICPENSTLLKVARAINSGDTKTAVDIFRAGRCITARPGEKYMKIRDIEKAYSQIEVHIADSKVTFWTWYIP